MNHTFYTIKPAVDTEETGHVFPAVESFDNYDFKGKRSVHRLNHWSIPDFVPEIRFRLAKGAKLCDIMGQATISGCGLLISEEMKLFLEAFNLGEHRFFEGLIFDNSISHRYYWLHLIWNDRDRIVDFEKSQFYKKRGRRDLGELDINSKRDYDEVNKQLGGRFVISFTQLVLKEYPALDLWPLPCRGDLMVSPILKEELESTGFSGLDISPIGHVIKASIQT